MGRPRKQVVPAPLLAASLASIASTGKQVEASAGELLGAIRKGEIVTLSAFDEAIKAAYEANGWNTRPGRPTEDRRSIPHTVRTYVWEIRSAYRAGIEVWNVRSMYELRMAKRDAKEAQRVETQGGNGGLETVPADLPPAVQQDLEGVRVLSPKSPNGALFHDLIACFIGLPEEERALFGRQLARLLHRYQPALNAHLATPAARRAAGAGA